MDLRVWMQYIFESQVPGCLPTGPVDFDHTAPYQNVPRLGDHSSGQLLCHYFLAQQEKRNRSCLQWRPAGSDDAEYELCRLDDVTLAICVSPLPTFTSFNFPTMATCLQ